MKYFAAFIGLVVLFAMPSARAQSTPDDQYVSIYSLLQQADSLQAAGQTRQALTEYTQADEQLQKFKKAFPDWNPRVVTFRLNYLTQKISDLTAKMPAQPVATSAGPAATAPTAPDTTSARPATDANANAQVQSLEAQNATLQAKLKEALQAQPASPDAQELAMSQTQVKSLLKENELLRASAQAKPAATPSTSPTSNSKEVKELQLALADAKQRLNEQTAQAARLAEQNRTLQTQAQPAQKSPDADALREENAMLKKQVVTLRTATAVPAGSTGPAATGEAGSELTRLRAQLAELQSDADIQWLENAALEKRLQQSHSSFEGAAQPMEERKAPPAAPEPKAAAPNPPEPAPASAVTEQKRAEPALAAGPETKTVAGRPGNSALAAEAQNYFAAHQYDRAAQDYETILRNDPQNGLALANLAAIELQQNKLSDADKHISSALAKSPNDAYDLSIYGFIKFRQQDFDTALDALNRAARLDPQNAQVQNYLGVTLSHKGDQLQAEAALLRAVELDPTYAAAHNNLAVIYINGQPPKAELARQHYQKALENGQPHNANFEKLLASKGAPVAEQDQ